MSTSVPENVAGVEILRMKVTDKDELGSPNANARFSLVRGNEGGQFSISTGPSKMEGILRTAKVGNTSSTWSVVGCVHATTGTLALRNLSKELDFEAGSVYTLLVAVTNEESFSGPVSTSTATVTVDVLDANEPPVFRPALISASLSEDTKVGSPVAQLRAEDPDTARKQSVRSGSTTTDRQHATLFQSQPRCFSGRRYKLHNDTMRWLSVDPARGSVKVHSSMDRESSYVRDGKYTVLVLTYDNGEFISTGLSLPSFIIFSSLLLVPLRHGPGHRNWDPGCEFIRRERSSSSDQAEEGHAVQHRAGSCLA